MSYPPSLVNQYVAIGQAQNRALLKSMLETQEIIAINILNRMYPCVQYDGHWMNQYNSEYAAMRAAHGLPVEQNDA